MIGIFDILLRAQVEDFRHLFWRTIAGHSIVDRGEGEPSALKQQNTGAAYVADDSSPNELTHAGYFHDNF
jgi:hypothetical protein